MNNKKAQEEMVGFALIVVVVLIIGLIFLGFALGGSKSGIEIKSQDLGYFLESLSQTNTDCAIRAKDDFAEVGDLIRECYNRPSSTCFGDSKGVCNFLNDTLNEIISESLDVGEGAYYEGFELNIDFEPRSSSSALPENIIEINEGNCIFNKVGNEHLLSNIRAEGSLVLTLNMCLGS